MAKSQKVSISVDEEDLKWLRKRARREGGNLSAVFAEGTRLLRQREARERLLARLTEEDGPLTEAELAEIRREWLG